jgi:hypothetical protein
MLWSAKLFVVRYGFPEHDDQNHQTHFPEAYVQCHLWCQTTEDLIRKKAKRGTHLEFYLSWVRSELERLREILRRLPALSKELDLHRNVVFTVLHNDGMTSLAVCHFYDEKVHWEMPVDQVPE